MTENVVTASLQGLQDGLQDIVDELARAGDAAGTPRVELERPREEKFGDFATNAALMLAPVLSSKPRDIAVQVAERAGALPGVASVDVAGPGFVNITMTDAWFLEVLRAVLVAGHRWGAAVAGTDAEPVLLEFVSANPTGPMVAASVRHAAYGDSLARVLRFAGHEVATEYYVNDMGGQVDKFGQSILARATGGEVPDGGYEGEYVAELAEALHAAEGDDPDELGRRGVAAMLEEVRADLDELGVEFDRFQSERELHDRGEVERALSTVRDAGHMFEKDGATFLRTTTWGDDKDRPVLRSSGAPTYYAADLGYLRDKYARLEAMPGGERGRLAYVLGADHHGYVARLRAGAAALGHDPASCEVVIMQLVNLVEEGEQKKMSKRRGEFVTARELVERIGTDAARFLLLQRSHDQAIDLDLDLATSQRDDNPVYYVQYAHARLCSIRRKAVEAGFDETIDHDWLHGATAAPGELHASEKRLAKRLGELPVVVAEAAARRQPHRIVHYAHELARDVASFYRDCRVMGEDGEGTPIAREVTHRRLAIAEAARVVLATSLDLVGVSAPQQM